MSVRISCLQKGIMFLFLSALVLNFACFPSQRHQKNLKFVTREIWGSVPFKDSEKLHQIKYLTIHHSGIYFDPGEDVYLYLRNLQKWSREEKGWIDIPYHYLMGMDGVLYEGRPVQYPGDTNTDYDPTGHLLICIIGNYEEQDFSAIQYENLVSWLQYFCRCYDIPVGAIKGHKDYTETLCPGENIYELLRSGQLQSDVKNF
jgi:hypothetical protein